MGSSRIAAMVLVLLNGSLGAEFPEEATASLLQVSQAPMLQAGSQAVSQTQAAPQTPPAQGVQSSVPTGGHGSPSASATPAYPAASSPADSQPFVPSQPVLASTASAVKSTQKVETNATALAFGQLTSLDTEFKSLHADDASHVRQLTYNVHLREKLQEKLRQAAEQLAEDNENLAQRTMQIIANGEASASSHTDDSQASAAETPAAADGNNETMTALLLEAAVVSRRNRELNNAQIAAQALDRVKALVDDISALKARDEEEIQALRVNAQSRNDLHKKIEERSDQLHQDTSMLLKDLGSIRDLVSKDDSTLTSDGSASETAPAITKQEGFQQASDATSNA